MQTEGRSGIKTSQNSTTWNYNRVGQSQICRRGWSLANMLSDLNKVHHLLELVEKNMQVQCLMFVRK
ncbi:hypothetical protein GQ457_11G003130 [Hibiscus cannabinus]